ncbi:MAG: hypothetical protein QXN87_04020 [Candidatus Bathyarchaeia archaeon]
MPKILIDALCQTHGEERYSIKIIRKRNIDPYTIEPKFRKKPKYGLSRIIIGRNVPYERAKEFLVHNIDRFGFDYVTVLSVRIQK